MLTAEAECEGLFVMETLVQILVPMNMFLYVEIEKERHIIFVYNINV